MVSFVQQVEGIQDTGIGNQQVVRRDNSYINTLSGAIQDGIRGIDAGLDAFARVEGRDLVRDAQQQVEQERTEDEELQILSALGDSAIENDVARETARLEKGVSQGRITRDNARLRVADLVTRRIEESPIMASRIRESASRLLGFDITSEASRQFFGSFQPAGSGGEQVSAFERRARFISDNRGIGIQQARELVALNEETTLRKSIAENNLSVGAIANDRFIAELDSVDQLEGVQSVLTNMLDIVNAGGKVDSDAINRSILQQEQAYINALETSARAAGRPLTTDQLATARELAKNRYEALREQLNSFDSLTLDKKQLERFVTAQKLFGTKAFPSLSFITNNFGERLSSSLFDLFAETSGNPQRLQAILDSSPALRRFIPILSTDPDQFNKTLYGSLEKLVDPDSELTGEDAALTDFFISQIGKNMPPTEHESLIEKLSSKGMGTKAVSSLTSRGRSVATPREVKFMQREWDLAQQTLPDEINTLIEQGNESLIRSNQGVTINVTEDGLLTLDKFKEDGVTPDPQRFLHPAYNSIQKINQFLKSTDKGWANDLGINNRVQTANNIKASIQVGAERMAELRAEAERRSRGE